MSGLLACRAPRPRCHSVRPTSPTLERRGKSKMNSRPRRAPRSVPQVTRTGLIRQKGEESVCTERRGPGQRGLELLLEGGKVWPAGRGAPELGRLGEERGRELHVSCSHRRTEQPGGRQSHGPRLRVGGTGGKGRLQSDGQELRAHRVCVWGGGTHPWVGIKGMVLGDSPGNSELVSSHYGADQPGLFCVPLSHAGESHLAPGPACPGTLQQGNMLRLFRRDLLARRGRWHGKMNRLTWPEKCR